MMTRSETVVFVLLAALTSNSHAFDGMEHERISDSAMLLAVSYWASHHNNVDLAGPDSLCDYLARRFSPKSIVTLVRHCPDLSKESESNNSTDSNKVRELPEAVTYGGVVRLVDELSYPTQIFVREGGAGAGDSGDPEGAYPRSDQFFAQSYSDLNHQYHRKREVRRKFRRTNAVLEGYRALSNNQLHFQNDLLQQMRRLRRDALNTVDQETYYALITNALSDHFLQDYLAPGHILWPRNYSHDSVATSVHDGTNQKGTWFEVDSTNWKDRLEPLAKYLKSLPTTSTEYVKLSDYWMKRREGATFRCGYEKTVGKTGGSPAQGLHCLQEAMKSDGYIYVYGDGLVSKSPAQQMLMVLVQAERIVELLRVLDGCEPRDYANFSYTSSYDTDVEKKLVVPCTGLEFGDYRFGRQKECNQDEKKADEVFEGTASGVFLLGGGGQAPFQDEGSSRVQFSLEYLPLGFMANHRWLRNAAIHKPPGNCGTFSPCNSGFVFGIDYIGDDAFNAKGVGARFIKAIPAINFQVSPYVKFLNYKFAQQDDWNLSWGLRADWGFSIGSFYMTLGKEYIVDEMDELKSTGMVSFGIGIGIPNTRIRKWTVDNRRYRPGEDY